MIYIKKRPLQEINVELNKMRHSAEWLSIKENDTEALRQQFDCLDKDKIRAQLAKEQHYICAYCMKKINPDEILKVKIEHFVPLDSDKDKGLDYNNFFLTCHGGEKSKVDNGTERILCCDSSKKNSLIELDPKNENLMKHIKYNKNGKVYYENNFDNINDSKYNKEINDILHLNGKWNAKEDKIEQDTSTNIVKGRRDAYRVAEEILRKLAKNNSGKMPSKKLENKISELENKEKYDEFIGVIIFVLKRRLRRIKAL